MLLVIGTVYAPEVMASGGLPDLQQPVNDPCLMKTFAVMLRYVTVRARGAEVAGFVVSESDGSLSFAPWRSIAGVYEEKFKGSLPDRVVAIAHTHPVGWADPSREDVREAVRVGLPIYVISEWRIWVIDPESESVIPLAFTGWKKDALRDHRCADDSSGAPDALRGFLMTR